MAVDSSHVSLEPRATAWGCLHQGLPPRPPALCPRSPEHGASQPGWEKCMGRKEAMPGLHPGCRVGVCHLCCWAGLPFPSQEVRWPASRGSLKLVILDERLPGDQGILWKGVCETQGVTSLLNS